MIQENFIHIDKVDTFNELKEQIPNNSLTFINESGTIYHKGEEFLDTRWDEIGYPTDRTIYYTTNNGNIINVHNYWHSRGYAPIINKYDKEKDRGIMVFENPLTEIPGISGNPFFYGQKNLLTLKLPNIITKFGRGAFWDCSNLNYINFIDLVNLEDIEQEWDAGTKIAQIDLRNTKLTKLGYLAFSTNGIAVHNYDYILLPSTIQDVNAEAFNDYRVISPNVIKTLMIPTLNSSNYYIEKQITENLIINKFDGIGTLHSFNTDCVIWVPDEWYNGYVEKYSSNDNILSRLKKCSEGVPEFPSN